MANSTDPAIYLYETGTQSDEDVLKHYYQGHSFFQTTKFDRGLIAVRKLARWVDPLTPPQLKNDCVKECHITPWDTFCCGWALRKRWMYCELFLEVRTASNQDIGRAIEECLHEATVAAALAAIIATLITGGAAFEAAKATFLTVVTQCLQKKLKDIVSISFRQSCGWGDWE